MAEIGMVTDTPTASPDAAPPASSPPAAPTSTGKPDWIAEKFWDGDVETSAKKMSASYSEMETKLTQLSQAPKPEDGLKVTPPTHDPNQTVDQLLVALGLQSEQLATDFATNGQLDPNTYAKLAARGISRPMADMHLQSQTALAAVQQQQKQAAVSMAQEQVGGETQMTQLLTWAGSNLTAPEIESINQRLDNPALINSAVTELLGRYSNAVGAGGATPLVTGSGSPGTGMLGTTIGAGTMQETINKAKRGDAQAQKALADHMDSGGFRNSI